jgi:hypothetical protein
VQQVLQVWMNGKYGIGQQVSWVDPEVGALAGAGADMAVVRDRCPVLKHTGRIAKIAVRMGLHGLMGQLYKREKHTISNNPFSFVPHPDAANKISSCF